MGRRKGALGVNEAFAQFYLLLLSGATCSVYISPVIRGYGDYEVRAVSMSICQYCVINNSWFLDSAAPYSVLLILIFLFTASSIRPFKNTIMYHIVNSVHLSHTPTEPLKSKVVEAANNKTHTTAIKNKV